MADFPLAEFDGPIHVIFTVEEAQKAVSFLKTNKILGFDTETKPSFTKGKINHVCLVQICTDSTCFLFRLNNDFTDILLCVKDLLEDSNVMKIGLSLKDDYTAIRRVTSFTPQNFIDLQSYVKQFGIEDNSLSKIYAIIFGKRISKSQRLTNWEADFLTDKQKKYAALDAWAAREIYTKLESLIKN